MANKYFWTISVNGATPVPMDNYASVKRRLQSQAVSTVTMREVLDDYADPTSLNWMNQISIFRNKVQWFYGWVTDIKRAGSSSDHSVSYVISDPWYFLEHTVFCAEYRLAISVPLLPGTPPPMPSSSDFAGAGFTFQEMIDLNLVYASTGQGRPVSDGGSIDSSSGHYPSNSPDTTRCFMDSDGYYYMINSTSHVGLNGYERDDYFNFITFLSLAGLGYVRINTQQQIIQVLEWAQTVYQTQNGVLPFTFSDADITPAVDMPTSEVKDQMCSEIIKNQLGVSPDAVTWFDYSQTPPALKIMQRGVNPSLIVTETYGGAANAPYACKVVDVDSNTTISTLSNFKTSNIHPRYDLVAPLVSISYEYTNTIRGQTYLQTIRDVWPPNDNVLSGVWIWSSIYPVNSLVSTVPMTGSTQSGQSANLLITDMGGIGLGGYNNWAASSAGVDDPLYQFWSRQSELFNDPTVAIWGIQMAPRGDNDGNVTDNNGNLVAASSLPNYIQTGQVADWMSLQTASESLSATVWFTVNGGSAQHLPVTANISTTSQGSSAKIKKFTDHSGDIYPEPVPLGLAQAIYESCQQMQYDGSVAFDEEECSSTVSIGNVLNIQDSRRPEWATMDAMIVSVEESLDTGTTEIEFGVTAHRGAADLVQILRAMRTRVVWAEPSFASGKPASNSQSELGDQFAVRDAQIKSGYIGDQVWTPQIPSTTPFNTSTPPPSPSGFTQPTLAHYLPDTTGDVPQPTQGYSAGATTPVNTTAQTAKTPSWIFGDQTGRKLAIRLTDLPENIKLKLCPVVFCDSDSGTQTTGYAFLPDTTASSGGVF